MTILKGILDIYFPAWETWLCVNNLLLWVQ